MMINNYLFLFTSFSKDISTINLIGILIGHLIFAIGLTIILDWSWLKNLMNEEDKNRMLKSYNWKDLIVDAGLITIVIGIIFLLISKFF